MNYLSIYRKYRPLVFAEVLGQEAIVKILKEASRQNRFAHAYIFAGPRGTGKTTLARLIAKSANCENKKEDGEPCNLCLSCSEINEGKSLDIVEIDGASNRGIDEIRNLKENVRFSPLSGRYKIFIIDEVHMLTKDAFNALLKTLEEPPSYVIFILATTEIERIPATIRSRAQQFYFKQASLTQIVEKIRTIAEKEKIKISNEALNLIAVSAEGSFRDAESLLDQLLILGDRDIVLKDVEDLIGRIGFDRLVKFAEMIFKNDLNGVLEELNQIHDGGYNIIQFTKDLIHYFRRTAVLKFDPKMANLLKKELSEDYLAIIIEHSRLFKETHLKFLKDLLNAYSQMRYSQFPIIPLEIALVENLKAENR